MNRQAFEGKSNIDWFGNISEGCDIFKSPLILVLVVSQKFHSIGNQSHALDLWIFTVYHPACWVLINMIFFLVCLTAHNWCCCLMTGLSKLILPYALQGTEAFISCSRLVVVLKSLNVYEDATTSIFEI